MKAYDTPDYIKVAMTVSEVFSSVYPETKCRPNEGGGWLWTSPCEGDDDASYIDPFTFVTAPQTGNCFTTLSA